MGSVASRLWHFGQRIATYTLDPVHGSMARDAMDAAVPNAVLTQALIGLLVG